MDNATYTKLLEEERAKANTLPASVIAKQLQQDQAAKIAQQQARAAVGAYGTMPEKPGITSAQAQTTGTAPAAQQAAAPVSAIGYDENGKPIWNTGNTNEAARQSLLDQINNREKFRYNFNDDALYNMYKDKYIQQGRMAMKDTMGQAAALTGGYGSSYGQAVGQQAYDRSLQNLNDVIPELYGQAFSIYQDEGNQLVNRYGLANDLVAEDWNRYRANVSDWNYEQEQAYQKEQDEYNRKQQAYANLASLISASGYTPTNDELAAAGMTAAAAAALRNEYLRATGQLNTGGGGGGGYAGGSDPSKKKTETESDGKTGNTVSVSDMLAPASMEDQYKVYSNLAKSSGQTTTQVANQAALEAARWAGRAK